VNHQVVQSKQNREGGGDRTAPALFQVPNERANGLMAPDPTDHLTPFFFEIIDTNFISSAFPPTGPVWFGAFVAQERTSHPDLMDCE